VSQRRDAVMRGEKRQGDVTGQRMLARTVAAMAFPDSAVKKAGEVLVELLDCDDPKERRLSAERIRDERGLTRVVKPTEHAVVHFTVSAEFEAAMQQGGANAKRIEHRVPRVDTSSVVLDAERVSG